MEIRRKIDTDTTIVFPLIDQANRPFYKSGAVPTNMATIYYWNDIGGVYDSVTSTNDPVEIGTSGVYSLDLTGDEMNVDPTYPIVVVIKDTGTSFDTQAVVINVDETQADVAKWVGSTVSAETAGIPSVDAKRISNSDTTANALETVFTTTNNTIAMHLKELHVEANDGTVPWSVVSSASSGMHVSGTSYGMQIEASNGPAIDASGSTYGIYAWTAGGYAGAKFYNTTGDAVIMGSGAAGKDLVLSNGRFQSEAGDLIAVNTTQVEGVDATDAIETAVAAAIPADALIYRMSCAASFKSDDLMLSVWVSNSNEVLSAGVTIANVEVRKAEDNSVLWDIADLEWSATADGRFVAVKEVTPERSTAYVVSADVTIDAVTYTMITSFVRL